MLNIHYTLVKPNEFDNLQGCFFNSFDATIETMKL